MKYMMMMHAPRAGWTDAGIGTDLGKSAGSDALAGKGAAPEVTDGPYPEAKEFLSGFWIVDCESKERAYELAARVSAAPGQGGVPLNMPVEVREVMSAPPVDM